MTESKINKIRARIYERALNHIDDYFEYRCESGQDKEFVITVLDSMTEQLRVAMKEG